jgi:uncharacterized protein YcbX
VSIRASARAVGTVAALYRFPVKSMGGEALEQAPLSWHGIDEDRGRVFVKTDNLTRFPWLTARDVPDLVRYVAYLVDPASPRKSAVRVRTPAGDDLPVESVLLRQALEREHGAPLHLMRLGRGAPDLASLSLIGLGTVRALGERIGRAVDVRRLRQNVVLEPLDGAPFVEEGWLGRLLVFGDGADPPRVRLLRRDHRCMIVNLDPDRPGQDSALLREIAESRENCAGVYASVEAPGLLRVGDPVYLD